MARILHRSKMNVPPDRRGSAGANVMLFLNRTDAGRQLALLLNRYARRDDVLVLALPRGGVPVGYEVAVGLEAPLDVFLVRKLGVPGEEELAMGAIASGGVLVVNQDVISALGICERVLQEVAVREGEELARREKAYRDDRPPPEVRGRCCVLVDDGLATGASMSSAIQGLRRQDARQIAAAAPVAAAATAERFRREADDFVCVAIRDPFYGVGFWYDDFRQTTDDEVRRLLQMANQRHAPSPA